LTDQGRDALRAWIVEPPALLRIQNEAIPKLLSGDILGDDQQLLETLLTLKSQIEEQQSKLDEARQRLEELPHRRAYLSLVIDLGNRLLQVQREWLDHVERELRKSK
jgi:chromosome segregation ATPase